MLRLPPDLPDPAVGFVPMGYGVLDLALGGPYYQSVEGSQFLFLSGGNAGSVYQDIATVPGQTYRIRYAMSGDPGRLGDRIGTEFAYC